MLRPPTDSCVRLIHVGRAPNDLLHIHQHPIQCTGKFVVYVCMNSILWALWIFTDTWKYDSLMTGKFDGQVLVVDTLALRAIVEGGEPRNINVTVHQGHHLQKSRGESFISERDSINGCLSTVFPRSGTEHSRRPSGKLLRPLMTLYPQWEMHHAG
jgi:hypothetical protein